MPLELGSPSGLAGCCSGRGHARALCPRDKGHARALEVTGPAWVRLLPEACRVLSLAGAPCGINCQLLGTITNAGTHSFWLGRGPGGPSGTGGHGVGLTLKRKGLGGWREGSCDKMGSENLQATSFH